MVHNNTFKKGNNIMKGSQTETSGNNSQSIVITTLEIIAVLIENYFKSKLNQSKYSPDQICRSAVNILLVLFILSALLLSAWFEAQAILIIYMAAHETSLITVLLGLLIVNLCLAATAYFCILKLKNKLTACF